MIDWLNPSEEMLAGLQAGREEMQNEIDQMYTKDELDEAVQARNEDCASVCDKKSQDYGGNNWSLAKECAEAIRARNK